MKRFVVRVALEFVAIATAAIVAAQLVKSGHPILGLWTLSLYGVFNLWRLGISKIDAEYNNSVKAARMPPRQPRPSGSRMWLRPSGLLRISSTCPVTGASW